MGEIVVTKKGERLISNKFGIPYGLFLAYVNAIPLKAVFAISFALGSATSINIRFGIILLIWGTLIWWAEKHFKV